MMSILYSFTEHDVCRRSTYILRLSHGRVQHICNSPHLCSSRLSVPPTLNPYQILTFQCFVTTFPEGFWSTLARRGFTSMCKLQDADRHTEDSTKNDYYTLVLNSYRFHWNPVETMFRVLVNPPSQCDSLRVKQVKQDNSDNVILKFIVNHPVISLGCLYP